MKKIKEEKEKQELDKMKKFWSKFKTSNYKNPPENKNTGVADESLPNFQTDGRSSDVTNPSESHASLPDRPTNKSESNLLAAPSNPVRDKGTKLIQLD